MIDKNNNTYPSYSDEYLDYYGNVYQNEKLYLNGIDFDMFLRWPKTILNELKNRSFEPLLPEQVRVAAQIRHDEAMQDLQQQAEDQLENISAVRRHNGFIEPLHHHRHLRKAPRYFRRQEQA